MRRQFLSSHFFMNYVLINSSLLIPAEEVVTICIQH